MSSRITRATFRSFIRKNPQLYLRVKSTFDGMTDCVQPVEGGFVPCVSARHVNENNLGIQGVWLVGGSRNSFREFRQADFTGIEVYNCCGSFIVAVRNP